MKKIRIKKPKNAFKRALIVIAMMAWVTAVFMGVEFIASLVLVNIIGADTIKNSALWMTVYSAIVYSLAAVITILGPKLIKKSSTREELGLTGLPTYTDIGLAILSFVATLFVSAILTSVMSAIFPNFDANQAQNIGYSKDLYGADRAIAFLALVVFAPIAEELIYRGWLYGKAKKYVPTWLAVILVSVLFGAMHGQWNVAITVGAMSVIMCIDRELTGTIYAGVLTHMIKNGVAFYVMYVLGLG